MSRRSLATVKQASAIDPASLVATPVLRIPDRMVLDILMLLEIGLVVAAAALGEAALYRLLPRQCAGSPALHAGRPRRRDRHPLHDARCAACTSPRPILGWRRRLGELLVAIGLSFLMRDRARLPAQDLVRLLARLAADLARAGLGRFAAEPTAVGTPAALARRRPATPRAALPSSPAGPAGGAWPTPCGRCRACASSACSTRTSNEGQGKSHASITDLITSASAIRSTRSWSRSPTAPQSRTARLIDELSVLPVDVWLCPAEFDMPILRTSRLGALSLLQVKPKPIRDWGYVMKLGLDYVPGRHQPRLVFAPIMLLAALGDQAREPAARCSSSSAATATTTASSTSTSSAPCA